MYHFKKVILLIVLSLLAQHSMLLFASDDKANEIIKKVKEKYEDIKTFSAKFTQTSYWKLADNVQQQQGTIWLKGKEKFNIETPDQKIVSNGEIVWTYSQFNNQVIIEKVDKASGEVRLPKDIFLSYAEQYHPGYLQDEKIDNEDCYVLELISKTDDIFIKYMKIWINKQLSVPIKIEQIDINNNTNTFILHHIEINKPIADNFFNYKVPQSVEVIDMR